MEFNFSQVPTTAVGMLALVFLAIVTGLLVPRWVVNSLKQSSNRETETYKLAWENEREANTELRAQNLKLLELAKTTSRVLDALPVQPDKKAVHEVSVEE